MGKPHVIVVPYPAQGHVIPMLELSQWLVKHGIKVTFVNTEFNHERVVKSLSDLDNVRQVVNMVSIPDGLEPWEDRNDLGKLSEAIFRVMPGELESLIIEKNINGKEGDKIVCVIADGSMGWALEVAAKIGVRRAAFWPAAATSLALTFDIPKLVSDGIIDSNGRILKNQMIQLSPTIPPMNSTNFVWACVFDQATRKIIFDMLIRTSITVKSTDWIICNSSDDLEPGTFTLFPDILPVGPLLASNRLGKSVGYFWPEDSACLAWLDQQPINSVIYVAFGSFTIFDQTQFEELAQGLELTNRPFLWVVRQDITANMDEAYPKDYKDRVHKRGLMVSWAPQQQVLSHPSIACFISHCGWNSTVEGIGNGVPFICWPYFADQFANQTYICDEWKIGLGLSKDECGIIRRGEIKDKLEHLLSDKSYKERVLNLQVKTMDGVRGGCSHKNFNNFIEWIKDN
ncbi:hypothetical protein DH2020_048830 [Rehmannia glutinosa]|uniref:Glycosyltransferase N-terminal domain-containing protein n=1 Tax=Rehmannia glutinosa TaxID=99300 RepID=A0ABR0U538_REHGL